MNNGLQQTNSLAASVALALPELKEGETYIGAIINADGTGHHIILLPGDNDDANLEEQKKWAESIGGELPNRIEQAIMFDKHKDQFKEEWYWSSMEHAIYPSAAWCQSFNYGSQDSYLRGNELRARAVRRLAF